MTEKRFVNIDGEMLYDSLGEMETIYHNDRVYFKELCDFLNEMEEKNQKLHKQLEEYEKIMRKYELDSAEKLDQVLMEQRVW